ncbi:unnamed protein product [Larinioides sclopetarius]|uniref:pyridoxal 5'-phosphate synthase n=1 Tax=Larinioides sclopetarius TaxID=280406 RepID=A0AAV1YUC6_9ARAC
MSKAGKSAPESQKYFTPKDPFIMFNNWFNEASRTEVIGEATAMALATASKEGKPSVRYVLMKSHTKEGFTFYTNYNSRKGIEIAENPQVALLFFWQPLFLQITIEGQAIKTDAKESEEYFHSRPKTNQLSAATSNQDEIVESMKGRIFGETR